VNPSLRVNVVAAWATTAEPLGTRHRPFSTSRLRTKCRGFANGCLALSSRGGRVDGGHGRGGGRSCSGRVGSGVEGGSCGICAHTTCNWLVAELPRDVRIRRIAPRCCSAIRIAAIVVVAQASVWIIRHSEAMSMWGLTVPILATDTILGPHTANSVQTWPRVTPCGRASTISAVSDCPELPIRISINYSVLPPVLCASPAASIICAAWCPSLITWCGCCVGG